MSRVMSLNCSLLTDGSLVCVMNSNVICNVQRFKESS